MSTHCPECRLNPSRYGPDAPGGPKVLSCPGCPDCADAAKWHEAIMAETCGEDEQHCACVPVLRKACADRDAQLYRLGDELAEAQLQIARRNAKLEAAERALAKACGIVEGP